MMWLLTFAGVFSTVLALQVPPLTELRQLFFEARDNEDKAEKFFDKVGNYNGSEGILVAYKAGAYALKAKHGANPLNKLKNIKKSQTYFSDAVKREPQNLEIRFMRYAVEVQTPEMLGYSEHVSEDKQLLLSGLKAYPKSGFTPETARIARDYLRQYCACSEQEKQFLQQLKL